MTPRLSPVSWRILIRRLSKLGFEEPKQGGNHEYMKKDRVAVRIPNPHGGDISVGLLAEILRQAGISREEWESTA